MSHVKVTKKILERHVRKKTGRLTEKDKRELLKEEMARLEEDLHGIIYRCIWEVVFEHESEVRKRVGHLIEEVEEVLQDVWAYLRTESGQKAVANWKKWARENDDDEKQYRLLSESDLLNGVDTKYQRGSLMMGSSDFELIMVNTFAQGGQVPGNYPIGRRYYSCVLLGSRESTVGTRVEEVSLVIEANGLFNATDRAFYLFTEDPNLVMNGIPQPT